MTALYDGKLYPVKGGVEPCCGNMHLMILSGLVYQSATHKLMMAVQANPKKGREFSHCPFCGAEAGI